MIKYLTIVTALLAVAGPALSAQQDTLTYVSPVQGTSDGRFYVGPYNGLLDHSSITMNCVDLFHQVVAGETWAVNITPFMGNLSQTRADNLTLYEEAAFLTTQYGDVSTAQDTANIHHAIWRLFASNTDLTNNGVGDIINAGSDYWLNFASSHYASAPIDYGAYEILTPIDPGDPNSGQEYITTVPEPTSVALLGMGLIGLLPMARHRREE